MSADPTPQLFEAGASPGLPDRLPLRNRDGDVIAFALVDADVHPALSTWRWSLSETGYAVRSVRLPDGSQQKLRLHRVVMCCVPGDGLEVDHVNRDRLDCRRQNLKIVTHRENMGNLTPRGEQQPRRPAGPHRKGSRWQAAYTRDGTRTRVGSFSTFCAALRALTDAARRPVVMAPEATAAPALVIDEAHQHWCFTFCGGYCTCDPS